MTEEQLQKEITGLWKIVKRLEKEYKTDNRRFTIDGHLLGSIGEVYAKEKFNLKLLPNSEKTHDAIHEKSKKKYQIKITQRDKVGLRSKPDNLIVIVIDSQGLPRVVYNDIGKPAWDLIKHKKSEQKFITIRQLEKIKKGSP